MKLYCPEDGGHVFKVGGNPPPGERVCPVHRGDHCNPPPPATDNLSSLSRSRRSESAAERRAREDFNRAVMQWPCFFHRHREDHVCDYPLDAHHLIPKDFIRLRFSELEEEELLPILFNPLIGAPLCRLAHNQVEGRVDYIYFEELSPELLAYVGGLPDFMQMRLEEESPKREVAI
jgi:hypothetical protein